MVNVKSIGPRDVRVAYKSGLVRLFENKIFEVVMPEGSLAIYDYNDTYKKQGELRAWIKSDAWLHLEVRETPRG